METEFATTAPMAEHAAIMWMLMGTEFAITAATMEAAIVGIMQILTEMESVIIIPAAVTAATAVTMEADIMEVITGRKYKGDILCAANRRSSRQ
jgi:hypothetical protein